MKKLLVLSLSVMLFSLTVLAQGKPKNVVLLIGDGMGLAQIYAGMVANGNKLQLERCKNVGFVKTYSASHFTTDSGAGGTALACGVKTKNGMIGMNADSVVVRSILEMAEKNNLATGIVSACTGVASLKFMACKPSNTASQRGSSSNLIENILICCKDTHLILKNIFHRF